MIAHNEDVLGAITGGVMPKADGEPTRARRITQADDAAMGDMAEVAAPAGDGGRGGADFDEVL
jgi:hypothetical protein